MLAAKIGANTRLATEETKKLATYLGEESTEITEQLVADLVPEFGEADFFEAAEAFASGDLAWTLDAIDRHFFHAKDSRPLLSSLQGRNRLVIQIRVLIDSGEIDPRSRLNKDVLDRIARKRSVHFEDASEKNALNIFTQNPWYLGRLVPAAAKYNTRRLIDFQSQFIRAFEQLLGASKEDQPTIMKELAIRCLGRSN
jgi:DNA polymerase-3 subunit delta